MARESPELATNITLVSKRTEQQVDPLNELCEINYTLRKPHSFIYSDQHEAYQKSVLSKKT